MNGPRFDKEKARRLVTVRAFSSFLLRMLTGCLNG